jgi:hypothetical protein
MASKKTRPETTQDEAVARYPSPPEADAAEGSGVPPGMASRSVVLTNDHWAAIDKQAGRGKITDSEWLRRFLHPYLRRG